MAQNPSDPVSRMTVFLKEKLLGYVAIGIAIALIVGFGYLILHPEKSLFAFRDPNVARGFITVLVAVSFVVIAVLLTLYALAGPDGTSGKERFDSGKQVLSVLVGVMGTVLGFYFGTTKDTASSAIDITELKLSQSTIVAGGALKVTGSIVGGTAPYTYTITFDPEGAGEPITDEKSLDGTIDQALKILPAAKGKVQVKLVVTDAKGTAATAKPDSLIFSIQETTTGSGGTP